MTDLRMFGEGNLQVTMMARSRKVEVRTGRGDTHTDGGCSGQFRQLSDGLLEDLRLENGSKHLKCMVSRANTMKIVHLLQAVGSRPYDAMRMTRARSTTPMVIENSLPQGNP